MYNNKEISSLSRDELSKALQSFKLKSGPITNTTRRIFENRLKLHLEKLNPQKEVKEEKENSLEIGNKCFVVSNGEDIGGDPSKASISVINNCIVKSSSGIIQTEKLHNETGATNPDEKHIKIERTNSEAGRRDCGENNGEKEMCNSGNNIETEITKSENPIKTEYNNICRNDAIIMAYNGIDTEAETHCKKSDSVINCNGVDSKISNGLEDCKENEKKVLSEQNMPNHVQNRSYYAVWIPFSPLRVASNNKAIICDSQQDALTKMKAYKGSRFKVFDTLADAETFSLSKLNPSCEKVPIVTPNTTSTSTSTSTSEVKVLKVPSFHDTIKFRQHIEKFNNKLNDLETCLANPRYLISSSDIPVILQEGSRMNAVHIAVKCNRLKVLKILFNYLQADDFLRVIYSSATQQELQFRKNHLLDLYLNTPEKILCDTPLHTACKFGYINIVKYLLTFKLLKVDAQNTERKTSEEVICDRIHARSVADREKTKSELLSLFQEKAYIPLYDNEDGMQSKIGTPIFTISPSDIYSSRIRIKAYAGPMSPDKASIVFQEWKKSPRHRLHSVIALSDYEKGMERIGRSIALNENVPFTEYWSFLDKYTNLRTPEGLKKLEKYLKSKYTASIQNGKKGDCTSSSSKKKSKNKNNRRSNDVPMDIDRKPDDIKRKLTFDEGKAAISNENSTLKNESAPLACLESLVISESTPIVSDNKPADSISIRQGVNESIPEISSPSSKDNMQEINKNTVIVNCDPTLHDDKNCKKTENVENNKNKNTDIHCLPEKEDTICKSDKNIANDELQNACEKVMVRCTSSHCLCDNTISEECYLTEAFSNLTLNSNVKSEKCRHLMEDGNVDMDLVNQSVSFHMETNPDRTVVNNNIPISSDDLPKESCSDNTILNNGILESNSDTTLTGSPSKLEKLSVDNTLLSSCSSVSSVSSPCDLSPSSYNSPIPSQVSIPGIINLSGKSSDPNCSPENAVFIHGEQPSKHDLDVLRAIDLSMQIDQYPHIRRWRSLVESFSDAAKSRWPSPGSPRYAKTKTKRRTSWTA